MYGKNIHHGFFHSNELNNMELYTLIKKYNIHNFQGVFSKDTLPLKMLKGFYIVNAQSSNDEMGRIGVHFLIANLNIQFGSIHLDLLRIKKLKIK